MGIGGLHAQLIALEHKYRPLPATVHLLGRQTVYLTVEDAANLIRACGVEPQHASIELDVETRGRLRGKASTFPTVCFSPCRA